VERREYPDRPVVGVGGVVISKGRALLVRRGRAPFQGEWSIPGGMLELGETILEGVRRELREETGIDAEVIELIEVFERIALDGAGKTQYHYVVLDYFCEPISGEAQAGSDAAEVAWAAEAELTQYSLTPTAVRVIHKALEMARKRGSPG
jgi:8-oxo-dGTP diphosphatase